ncbi:pilus assembly protein N-terminal domain-containing protein [Spiribacter sp. 221]|uniref:type II and III secretion system protein family protein n=1 Tax=Spiribacter onubensis TaxID=3122420 RepID=UPI00349F05BA
MRWLTALTTLVGLLCSAGVHAIELTVGHSRVVEAEDVIRVALGDGELAEVEVIGDGEGVLLIGRAPGRTDLRLWSGTGETRHMPVIIEPRARERTETPGLERLVERIEGVQLERLDGRDYLTGQPDTERDRQRLARVLETHPEVGDFTDPPPITETPTVNVKARFVELRKSALRQIGLDWATRSPGISFAYASDLHTNEVFRSSLGGFLPADALPLDIGQGNGYLGIGVSLTAMIDLLGQSGQARVIAEPMLSALSGSTAEFQAGGEVPIPVQGDNGNTSVTFKDYGILLRVAPTVGDGQRIRTSVEVEVSDVDQSVTVLGVPGFSVRNAVTEMNARSGETLLIAGLIDDQQSRAVSQVPGLGDLPIIGELFKSRRFQNEQTELVVLITPTLGRAAASQSTMDDGRVASKALRATSGRLPLEELGQ